MMLTQRSFPFPAPIAYTSCFPRPGDLLLARDGGEGGRKFGLRERIEKEEGGPMACRVVPWQKGEDVYSAFESELVGVREMAA